MSQYTTGELAKLCGVSVRTVQFYDQKSLLKPTELSEGGRRLYTDSDLKKLRLICLLKTLGLSLDSIKSILESDAPENILLLLLDEQERRIQGELEQKKKQREAIAVVKQCIVETRTIPVHSISDIESMMKGKRKLKKTHGKMLAWGIAGDVIEIGALLLWIIKGIWIPFAIGMPIVIVIMVLVTRMYYRDTAYLCPTCHEIFRPSWKQFLFSAHTPRTRKLTCPACGTTGFCIETAAEEKEPKVE